MCLMNSVLRLYLDKFVIVLINGKLLYSKKDEVYVENLKTVLRLLR